MSRRTLTLSLALAGALSSGCMKLDDAQPIKLDTHVTDWRDEIIYQVLVDRFANGDSGNDYSVNSTSLGKWHGGDWKGVEDRLDYIQGLGVTTLWISPVVKNVDTDAGFDGYHGYWTQDFDSPNPHFGDVPALRRMVAAAHAKGMKVILDIVTNHMGQLFYYDINKNGQPDNNVYGYGCDKFRDPNDPNNPYTNPNDPDPSCLVKKGESGIVHVSEYDPDFSLTGPVEAYTSLGNSGPAPIVFNYDPATNHMPPLPAIFQDPTTFHRRGRTVDYSDGDQLLHGDFPGGLKDIDTTRCDVKQALVDSYARWVELADFDGFRIDTVKHVEPEFWRYFTQKVRQRLAAEGKTNFFMFGEAFDGDDVLVGSFTKNGDAPGMPAGPQGVLGAPDLGAEQKCLAAGDTTKITGDMLDSLFYFPQYYAVMADVFRDGHATTQIQGLWDQRSMDWGSVPARGGVGVPPSKLPVNFLDNHDVGRFLFREFFHTDTADILAKKFPADQFDAVRDARLKNAFVFLFTEQGIPCVYYGDEQGFEGGNDPANREDLWTSGYVQAPTASDGGVTYGRFYPWIQKLTALRKKYRALTHGDQKVVWATDHTTAADDDAGVFAFERAGGDAMDRYALVVLNTFRDSKKKTSSGGTAMKVSAAPGTMLADVLADQPVTYAVAADGTLELEVPPLGAVVLVPQSQVSGN